MDECLLPAGPQEEPASGEQGRNRAIALPPRPGYSAAPPSPSSGRSPAPAETSHPAPNLAALIAECIQPLHPVPALDPRDELSSRTHYITLAGNVALVAAKAYVYSRSASVAVFAALIDSAIDLVTQGFLLVANRASRAAGFDEAYPAGRSRLEPIAVVCCAIIVGLGAVEVVSEACAELLAFALRGEKRAPRLHPLDLLLILATVAYKAALYAWCVSVRRRTRNVTIGALAQDNWNDLLSNATALLAAGATQLRPSLWICDPVGALLISVYIASTWALTAVEHVQMIIGRSAAPNFVGLLRRIVLDHDPAVSLDVLRAYHFGPKFLVELEVVMPHDTLLSESHDVAVRLQHRIERLDAVERCFVHVDYTRRAVDEHDPAASLSEMTIRHARSDDVAHARAPAA